MSGFTVKLLVAVLLFILLAFVARFFPVISAAQNLCIPSDIFARGADSVFLAQQRRSSADYSQRHFL
jgi:hypothetical protein